MHSNNFRKNYFINMNEDILHEINAVKDVARYSACTSVFYRPFILSKFNFRAFANSQRRGLYRRKQLRHAIQEDSSSCGVLTAKFAEAYLREDSMIFPVDGTSIQKYRERIWHELIRASDRVRDLCFRCGEEDEPSSKGPKNNWVSIKRIVSI